MPAPSAPPPARQDRRKERTRAALLAAAQQLLSTGDDAHASIQVITNLADVGFGSFYNYFSSKEELFDAAMAATVADYFRWLDERVPEGTDAVERLIASMRQMGRLALEEPRIAAILMRRPTLFDDAGDVRGQRIRADVRAAMTAAGVAPDTVDFDILVTAVLGATMAVLRRTISLSPAETADAAEVLAHAVLRVLRIEPTATAP